MQHEQHGVQHEQHGVQHEQHGEQHEQQQGLAEVVCKEKKFRLDILCNINVNI